MDQSRIRQMCIFRVKRPNHHLDSPPGSGVSREPPHVCVTAEGYGRVAAHVSPREANEGVRVAECRRKRERRAIFRPRARNGGPSARGSGALFARKFQAWEIRHRTFNKTRRASSPPLRPSSLSTTTPAASALLKLAVVAQISIRKPTSYTSLNTHGPYQGLLTLCLSISPFIVSTSPLTTPSTANCPQVHRW